MPKVWLLIFPFWTPHFFRLDSTFWLDSTLKLYCDLLHGSVILSLGDRTFIKYITRTLPRSIRPVGSIIITIEGTRSLSSSPPYFCCCQSNSVVQDTILKIFILKIQDSILSCIFEKFFKSIIIIIIIILLYLYLVSSRYF